MAGVWCACVCALWLLSVNIAEVEPAEDANHASGNTPSPSQIIFPDSGGPAPAGPVEPDKSGDSGPGCRVPDYPHNRYTVVSCSGPACSRLPGQKSPANQLINITCEDGYHLLPSDYYIYFLMINCKKDGDYWRPVPECVKKEPSHQTFAGCPLPSYPPHVNGYKLWKCDRGPCAMLPGRSLPHKSNLFVTCEEGYATAADQDTPVCNDGHWTRPIPQCYQMCPPLFPGDKIEAVCGEAEDPCDTTQPFNITATFLCPEMYSPSPSTPMTCGPDGRWSTTIPQCEMSCGIPQPGNSVDPAAMTGRAEAKAGNFPWHATIFRRMSGEWTNVCSGVLITKNHILTAADCVVKPRGCNGCHPPVQKMRPSELMVALGKTRRHLNPMEQHEIRRTVKSIGVRNSYLNLYVRQKDYANVAVLRMDSPVMFNGFILPVCMDIAHPSDNSTISSGYMSGWARGGQCSAGGRCNEFYGDNLLYDTQVINKPRQCFTLLMNAKYSYVTERSPYHLCTTNSKVVAEHITDPGAGLTYKINDQHYIMGVFLRQIKDNSGGFDLFTKVNSFEKFINEEIREATPLPACTLPDYPRNVYTVYGPCSGSACSPRPGDKVPHNLLVTISCQAGYHLTSASSTHSTCSQGTWSNTIPNCDSVCPPLESTTLNLECWQGPELGNCSRPQPLNTLVRYKCKPYYSLENTGDPTYPRCIKGGQWSSGLPSCKPECGHSNLNSAVITPVIINGMPARAGNIPWHAALFHNIEGKWTNVCGGSLITTRHVLTAAHCVTLRCDTCKPEKMRPAEVMVALGKNHRDWSFREESEVKRSVSEIHVGHNFRGQSGNYDRDIALVELDAEVTVNPLVMPVCLDLEKEHFHKIASSKNLGIVSGWGHTENCRTGQVCSSSDTLQYGKTRIHLYNECVDLMQKKKPTLLTRLSTDKLCTEYGKESVIQKGDSGGGLVFRFGKLHFIYGVTSVKLNTQDAHSIGTFTDVSENLAWIRSLISTY